MTAIAVKRCIGPADLQLDLTFLAGCGSFESGSHASGFDPLCHRSHFVEHASSGARSTGPAVDSRRGLRKASRSNATLTADPRTAVTLFVAPSGASIQVLAGARIQRPVKVRMKAQF